MGKKLNLIKGNKKGSLLWELMMVLFILFAFLYSCITFLGAYTQYEHLSYAAKTLTRQIEVSGSYNTASIQSMATDLLKGTKLDNVEISVVPDANTAEDKDSALAAEILTKQRLQLTQQFTVTLKANYPMWLFGGGDGSLQTGTMLNMFKIDVPMSYKLTGISEVYWRTGQ